MDKEFFYSTGLPPALHFQPMSSSSSIPSWQFLASSAMDIHQVQPPELNCPSGQSQSPDCYLNPSWEKSTDQNHHFDSARSSMVSSPVASNSNNIISNNDSFVLRELIGKLVNIRDPAGEISLQSQSQSHAHAHLHPLLGNISTASYMSGNNSTNTSCYNTPLSSPPKLNSPIMDHLVNMNLPGMEKNSMPLNTTTSLMEISGDPGFAERAARFSCFGSRSFNGRTSQSTTQYLLNSNAEFPYGSNYSLMGNNAKMARVSSSPSLKALELNSPIMQDGAETDRKFSRLSGSQAEFANSPEESPVSEQIPGGESGMKPSNDMNSRKRKAVSRGKAKELATSQSAKAIKAAEGEDDSNAKRHKMIQGHGNENGTIKAEEEQKENTNSAGGDEEAQEQAKTSPKPPEPLKDYIHVRARRGQATDSHSLAERVRREKIGERMKLLQDLVPGCNKVTGKALMLDEIINYVQSLQHQVEFLSMKLASVDFGTDSSMESHLSKDLYQSNGSSQHQVYGHQSEQRTLPRKNISNETVDVLDTVQYRNLSMQLPPLDGFSQGIPQFPALCEDDLQSLVQMGLARI